jgi:hypothetical protein
MVNKISQLRVMFEIIFNFWAKDYYVNTQSVMIYDIRLLNILLYVLT